MQNQAAKRASGGTWLWQALTGVLVVLLLGLHMVAQHFVAPEGLRNYQEVLAYIRNPVVIVLELIFLVVVTYHALLGIRAIFADLRLSRRAHDTINVILTVAGVLAVMYGCYLTYVLVSGP
jgi:succinate dehydrogenase / fumarate reductase membrane anchor subunit